MLVLLTPRGIVTVLYPAGTAIDDACQEKIIQMPEFKINFSDFLKSP